MSKISWPDIPLERTPVEVRRVRMTLMSPLSIRARMNLKSCACMHEAGSALPSVAWRLLHMFGLLLELES